MTPAAKALGAPFKPSFGLSGLGCLPDLFVIRRGCDFIDFHVKSSSFKRNCHPACPGVPWNRSEVELLFLFRPSDLTAPNKSHRPPLVIPRGCDFIDFSRDVIEF
jgi:hypothetical protein